MCRTLRFLRLYTSLLYLIYIRTCLNANQNRLNCSAKSPNLVSKIAQFALQFRKIGLHNSINREMIGIYN